MNRVLSVYHLTTISILAYLSITFRSNYALILSSKLTLNTTHHLTNFASNLAAIITLPETDQ